MAPSPPKRQERGLGRNGPRRETTYNSQDARDGGQSGAAAGGGAFQHESRSTDEGFPYQKHP
jgi:hypothetical protein